MIKLRNFVVKEVEMQMYIFVFLFKNTNAWAMRSKAWVCGGSLASIVGSNPA
jgi:hypothetical protein